MDTTLGLAGPPAVSRGLTPTMRAILHPRGGRTQNKLAVACLAPEGESRYTRHQPGVV